MQQIKQAPATFLLIIANIVVFIVSSALDNRGLESLSQASFLIDWGANLSVLTMSGEYWRLLSSMFLHVSLMHITFNMLALWSLGFILEQRIGTIYFMVLYLLSGLAGSLLSAVTHQHLLYTSCGASGAILGLFGAGIIYAIKHPNQDGLSLKNLGLNLLLIFALGLMAHVDNMAHLGGLVAGLIMCAPLALFNLSAKLQQIVKLCVAILTASVIAISYNHYDDAAMKQNIALAKLDKMLGTLGFKGSYFANSYMSGINSDIEVILTQASAEQPANTLDQSALNAASVQALKALDNPELFLKEGAETYAKCQQVAVEVSAYFTQPQEQAIWQQLGAYCKVHQQAFNMIAGENKAAFNPQLWLESSLKMDAILQTESAINLLNEINELAAATVNESGCPYTSCKRFK